MKSVTIHTGGTIKLPRKLKKRLRKTKEPLRVNWYTNGGSMISYSKFTHSLSPFISIHVQYKQIPSMATFLVTQVGRDYN